MEIIIRVKKSWRIFFFHFSFTHDDRAFRQDGIVVWCNNEYLKLHEFYSLPHSHVVNLFERNYWPFSSIHALSKYGIIFKVTDCAYIDILSTVFVRIFFCFFFEQMNVPWSPMKIEDRNCRYGHFFLRSFQLQCKIKLINKNDNYFFQTIDRRIWKNHFLFFFISVLLISIAVWHVSSSEAMAVQPAQSEAFQAVTKSTNAFSPNFYKVTYFQFFTSRLKTKNIAEKYLLIYLGHWFDWKYEKGMFWFRSMSLRKRPVILFARH